MGAPGPGLSQGFLQMGVSAYTMHSQFTPPPPPAPPIPFVPGLIEGPGFMYTPVSIWTRKISGNVFFDGNPACQEGHDMGFFIPHFAIPMNVLCAVNTALSKHKVLVPVGKVQINGKSMGSYIMFLPGQLSSDPVSLPTAVLMLLKCTVWGGVTWADVGAMAITSVKDAALDAVFFFLCGGTAGGSTAGRLFGAVGKGLFGKVSDTVLRTFAQNMLESAGMKFVKDVIWEGFALSQDHPLLDELGVPTASEL